MRENPLFIQPNLHVWPIQMADTYFYTWPNYIWPTQKTKYSLFLLYIMTSSFYFWLTHTIYFMTKKTKYFLHNLAFYGRHTNFLLYFFTYWPLLLHMADTTHSYFTYVLILAGLQEYSYLLHYILYIGDLDTFVLIVYSIWSSSLEK